MRQQPDIQFKFINSLKIKAPGGLFSFSYYYKYLLFTLFIVSFIYSNEKQSLGFIAYNSNKWNNSIVKSHNNDIYNNGLYSMAELNFGPFKIVNSMFATSDSLESLKGGSKKVKGIYGYTNRAFITTDFELENVKNNILFGREYLSIGHGKFGSLILSNGSRPFDQLLWSIKYKDFAGGLGGIQLENNNNIKRFLTYHTIGFKNDKFSMTFTEAIIYTGVGRSIEWQYINPVLFWTPEMVNNSTGDGNGLLFGSIKYNFNLSLSLWTELLVDDFQVNHESKGDLEPNEIGFLSGVEKTGWPFVSSDLWLEYTRITNRTYQTPDVSETYTHRGFPIGHYLGNDFDMFQLYYSQVNMNGKLKPYISLAYLRNGANGLDTPFDTPWEDSTVTMETGYSEPFPTGPITYVTEMELAVDYHIRNNSMINGGLLYRRSTLQGETEEEFTFVLRLWLSLNKTFNY